MLNTALYAINFGDFYYENLDCFANYSKFGLKEIVLVHVIDPALFQHNLYSVYKKEDEERIRRFAEIKLKDIKKDLEKSGFGVRYVIKVGNIAGEIAQEAKNENIDFVVLDKKANIESKGFLSFYGSPLYDILIKVDKPILIMKRVLLHATGVIKNDEKMNCKNLFADVVFATDFSEFSLRALPFINKVPADIIKMFTILYVIDEKAVKNLKPEEIKDYEKNIAEKAGDAIRGLNYRFTKEKSNLEVIVRKGVPCKEITDFMIGTRKKLLILGHKGKDKEKLAEILFGSTAERVVNALPCSILIVK
ncbi:MAG: universal stress protein [Deltaproteobacteria bacterium]|nr:universal stress protein [Deltaproteobacteria bacterium]